MTPVDQNYVTTSNMYNSLEQAESDLPEDGSEFIIKGGAPYDPKTCPKSVVPFAGIPFHHNPEYSPELNKMLGDLMAGPADTESPQLLSFYQALDYFLNDRERDQETLDIFQNELIKMICAGAVWNQFEIIKASSPYSKPYMTTARFKCGKVNASITSSCSKGYAHDPACYSTLVVLSDDKQTRSYVSLDQHGVELYKCSIEGEDSWITLYPTGHFDYHFEIVSPFARVDYFKNIDYLGSNDLSAARSDIEMEKYLRLVSFYKVVPSAIKTAVDNMRNAGAGKWDRTKISSKFYSITPLPATTTVSGNKGFLLIKENDHGQ